MTDRAICVYDDDRRRAAYGVGDEGLAERIHRDRFEERPFPSVEELRDGGLFLVGNGQSWKISRGGERHHLGEGCLAGAAPCRPEEQDVGAAFQVG